MTINDWVKRSHDTSVSKGWWDDVKWDPEKLLASVPEKLMLIVTEVAEAMEDYRTAGDTTEYALGRLQSPRMLPNGKPVGFAIELADVAIRVFDLCGVLGINLEEALTVKAAYNATRPHRHGGKRA